MDKTEQVISSMMKESTGKHFLDSGMAYGRHFQRNQSREFDNEPACQIQVYDNEVTISYNLYHFLCNFLQTTRKSELLTKSLLTLADTDIAPEVDTLAPNWMYRLRGKSWSACIAAWIKAKAFEGHGGNSNYDNMLSQVIQYHFFTLDGDEDWIYSDELFVILQIHNGCDVRGGYTAPHVFRVLDGSYFFLAMRDCYAHCDCSEWTSDDCGYHWYGNGTAPSPEPNWDFDADQNKIFCADCKEEVRFSVMEGF